jgi:hypothetical protein
MGVLIFEYKYHVGGLGDMMTGIIWSYYITKKFNYELKIYYNNHPFINYFDNHITTEEKDEYNPIYFNFMNNEGWDKILHLEKMMEENRNIIVNINTYGKHSDEIINDDISSYNIINLLRPNKIVIQKLTKYIPSFPYKMIHIRFGDKYLNKYDNDCLNDVRSDENNIKNKMNEILSKICDAKNIYLSCDSIDKQLEYCELYNIKNLCLTKQHCSYRNMNNDETGYLDSVIEFIIIGLSDEIIAITLSGYSKLAKICCKNFIF